MLALLGMLGIGMVASPMILVGIKGIGNMISEKGVVATIMLMLSFPFYVFTVLSMLKGLVEFVSNISSYNNSYNMFEWVSLINWHSLAFMICFICLYFAFGMLHKWRGR